MSLTAAVITCSDRAHQGVYEDLSGPIIRDALRKADFEVGEVMIVPDDAATISAAIQSFIKDGIDVVFTTGGTGVSPRDVTVDATQAVLDYELPGIAEEVRRVGLQATPMSIISRAVAGVASVGENRAIVINAPGSKGGAKDTVKTALPVLPHLIELLNGRPGPSMSKAH